MYFTDQDLMQRGHPLELNFEGPQMQKWNVPTDRAQEVDEKNGVACLVIMFGHRAMVIKMSKMAYPLYILMMTAKYQSQFGKNI